MLVDSAPHAASRTGAEPLLLPLPRVPMCEDCNFTRSFKVARAVC